MVHFWLLVVRYAISKEHRGVPADKVRDFMFVQDILPTRDESARDWYKLSFDAKRF